MDNDRSTLKRWGAAAALGAGGLLVGVVLASTLPASADETTTPSPSTSSGTTQNKTVDESQPQRPDEKLLTGDTAAKVKAAALAKYPGATVLRIETDSDGVYEAHLVTSDGTRVTVEVDKSFAVTGEESMPASASA